MQIGIDEKRFLYVGGSTLETAVELITYLTDHKVRYKVHYTTPEKDTNVPPNPKVSYKVHYYAL